MRDNPGVRIIDVTQGSDAWIQGFRPGDRLLAVENEEVEDLLAARFLFSGVDDCEVLVEREDGTRLGWSLAYPEDILEGMELEPLTVRRCENDCIYCFCKQNPPEARPSLSFRDEDFRMSFLAGYYTTLSSLSETELARIVRHRLSPQYVTVPATDEEVRSRMLGRTQRRPIMTSLCYLVSSGVMIHVQIVVCPGLNDGAELHRTLHDLASLGDGIASVAVVPVGTTKFTPDPRVRGHSQGELRSLLSLVRRWQRHRPWAEGVHWVEAADEVYVALGLPVPRAQAYGDMPQLSSGVGMVRCFLKDFSRLKRRQPPSWWGKIKIMAVTGELFGPLLGRMVADLNRRWGQGLCVVSAQNDYLGPQVTVSGLLSGADIARAAAPVRGIEVLLLPGDSQDEGGAMFLDNMLISELQVRMGIERIVSGQSLSDCFSLLSAEIS